MIKPILLWTDGFILVLAITLAALLYAVKTQKIVGNWKCLYQQPGRVMAMVVLGFFVLVASMDSLHYQLEHAADVTSVLDIVLKPIVNNVEKTYSKPFATVLFTPEWQQLPGTQGYAWVSPRLVYGGAHLLEGQSVSNDVANRCLQASVQALAAWGLLLIVGLLIMRSRIKSTAWVTFWLSVAVLVIVVNICLQLMPYYHILGTDKVGRDVFYAAVKSIRTGLIIGTLTTIVTLPFALIFGTMAGYFRGWIDDVIQYLYTTVSSVPAVLLIAAGVLSLDVVISRYQHYFTSIEQRADLRLLMLCVILGLTSWTSLCRLLRGETLKIRELEYITAAKALGVADMKVIFRHIMPNLLHIVLIALVLDFSGLVLAEAVLSYVGVGVDPSMFSWGNMINGARMEMAREPVVWWSLFGAFSLMFVLVLAANVFADAVRDACDPRLRGMY